MRNWKRCGVACIASRRTATLRGKLPPPHVTTWSTLSGRAAALGNHPRLPSRDRKNEACPGLSGLSSRMLIFDHLS